MIILFFVFVALMIERIIFPKQALHREVIPPVPHVPRDHLPAPCSDITDTDIPCPRPPAPVPGVELHDAPGGPGVGHQAASHLTAVCLQHESYIIIY